MKGKQLLILLLVLAIAGGIGLYLRNQNQAAWERPTGRIAGEKVLGEFDPNAATSLSIRGREGPGVTLTKGESGWVVKERADYPADFDKMSGFVRQLWDLKAVQEVPATEAQLSRLGLSRPKEGETPAGTVIELSGKDGKPIAGLMLGKMHYRDGGGDEGGGMATGRYVLTLADSKPPFLVSETFPNAEPKPEQWLSKDFLKIQGIQSVALEGKEEGMQWMLKRQDPGGAWELEGRLDPEKLDTGKVPSIDGLLGSPRIVDVLPDPTSAEGLDQPARIVVGAADGFRYEFEIGTLKENRFPVRVKVSAELAQAREAKPDEKPEDKERLDKEFEKRKAELAEKLAKEKTFEGRVFLMEEYSIKPLLVKRSDLLAPPATPTPTPAPGEPGAPAAPAVPSPSPGASPRISVTTEPVSLPTPKAKKDAGKKADRKK